MFLFNRSIIFNLLLLYQKKKERRVASLKKEKFEKSLSSLQNPLLLDLFAVRVLSIPRLLFLILEDCVNLIRRETGYPFITVRLLDSLRTSSF